MTTDVLSSVDAFAHHLAAHWTVTAPATSGRPPVPVRPATRLREDLGADSLALLELLLVVEDLGLVLDDDHLARCRTVADVYACACSAAGRAPTG